MLFAVLYTGIYCVQLSGARAFTMLLVRMLGMLLFIVHACRVVAVRVDRCSLSRVVVSHAVRLAYLRQWK